MTCGAVPRAFVGVADIEKAEEGLTFLPLPPGEQILFMVVEYTLRTEIEVGLILIGGEVAVSGQVLGEGFHPGWYGLLLSEVGRSQGGRVQASDQA